MEIGPIASPAALDALVALAAPLETGEATVAEAIEPTASAAPMHEDFGEHLLSQAQPHAAAEPSQVPAAAADPLTETATAQTFVRAQPQTDASPTKADTTLPSAAHALSEFAVPASQLVPTMVIGLQVEPARILPQPTTPLPTRPAARDNDEPHAGGMPYEDSPEQPDAQEEHTDREPASPASEPDTLHDAGNDGGCEAIARVLHTALAATTPPPALLAAADQWQRGRCVVFQTAVAVMRQNTGFADAVLAPVTVRFRELSDAEIEHYLRTEQPYDCAGSAKSEALGIALLRSLESDDPTALVGLPLIRTCELLRRAGLDPLAP